MRTAAARWLLSSNDARAIAGIAAFVILFFSPSWMQGRGFPTDGQYTAYLAQLEIWSDAWIGGWPAGADTAAFMWYPLRIAMLQLHFGFDAFVIAAYVIAALGTYTYLRVMSAGPLAAAAGGLTFACCGFMVGQLAHTSIIHASAWVPWMFAGVEGVLSRQQRRWSFVAPIAAAMALLAGHMQLAFYGLVALGAYLGWRLPLCFRERRLRSWWIAMAGVATGVLLAAPHLLMTVRYLDATPRTALSFAAFVSYSFPPIQLPTLLFPYLFGDGSFTGQPFFGPGTFVETCCYVPFLSFALAIPALEFRRNIAVFWILVAGIGLLLALGGSLPPLAKLMFHVPGFNLFRAPGRHVMEVGLAMSVLSGFGVQALTDISAVRRRFGYLAVTAAFAMVVVVAGILSWMFIERYVSATVRPQPWFRNPAIGMGLLGIVAGTAAFSALVLRFRYRRAAFVIAVLVGCVSFAGFSYWRWFGRRETPAGSMESEIAERIRDGGGRMLYTDWRWGSDVSAERARKLGMRSVNWYGPLIPLRAKQMLDMSESGAIGGSAFGSDNAALDVYGVRFVAVKDDMRPKDIAAHMPLAPPRWERLGSERGATFYSNTRALPLGWLCPAWRGVSPIEALDAIRDMGAHGFDPRREALVSGLATGGDLAGSGGSAAVKWDGSGTIRADVDAPADTFLVVSVNAIDGWTATVDGAPRPVYDTDYSLLGLPVEAGHHEIILRYRVPVWEWAVPWGGVLIAVFGIMRFHTRRNVREDERAR